MSYFLSLLSFVSPTPFSVVWVPLVETAHLVNSIRTRSALVSITMVSSFTAQLVPTTPPLVVI